MKAIRYHSYGPPEVLALVDVPTPEPAAGEVLVRIRAASANPLDFHFMRGTPYFLRLQAGLTRPKVNALGVDLAGTVEAVGAGVTGFRPGDDVFGSHTGAFAEYVAVPADKVLLAKPANLTFEQAAAVPVAGFSALQALRDKGRLQPGQTVLVNGAAGGVGTFAVQLAKALGAAEVTGVCGTGNVELVRSLGADTVVDYTRDDFTRTGKRYDVMIDMAGNRTPADRRRVLTPGGVLVAVGGPDKGNWLGPVTGLARMVGYSMFVRQTMTPFLARPNRDDLAVLGGLLAAGTVTSVVDRTYPLADAAEAIRYLERGHARGKVVITV